MSWALLTVATLLPVLQEDDRTRRILERIEKEIQLSEARLREDIRAILRAAAPPRGKVLIGITADDFTDAERKRLGVAGGIKVAAVRGPAAEAGLQAGDILLSLEGRPVTEETIGALLAEKSPGDEITAQVLRGTEKKSFKIVLQERQE